MTMLTYEKTVNLTWLVGVASVLTMPDALFGILLELAHLMLELVHLAFEVVESALDHLVEHHFHTGTRETQLIVFYILATFALGGFYFLWRITQRVCRKIKQAAIAAFLGQKNRILMYWAESANNKFKLIAGFNVALTVVYLVSF